MFTTTLRTATTSAVRASRVGVPRGMATVSDRFPTKIGGKYQVTLVPGDGIGNELADSVKEVFDSIKVPITFDQVDVVGETEGKDEKFLEAMDSLRRNKVGLKGIIYTPPDSTGHNSWNVAMRQTLDIYASVVVAKSLPGVTTRHTDVDISIIRENTEGEYAGLEHSAVAGVVESLKVTTRAKSERIARFAFDYALKNNRKASHSNLLGWKVTIVHKANIMKMGDGLWMRTAQRVFEDEYKNSGLQVENMIVDNMAMQLVSRPQQFDVMVMPNLYGAISSNIASALVGGPGIVPGCNLGKEVAVFEPGCRHVGKDIAGKNVANPTAMLLSSTMLLRHLGLDNQANLIASAVYDVVKEGKHRTADMGGNTSTTDFTKAIVNRIV